MKLCSMDTCKFSASLTLIVSPPSYFSCLFSLPVVPVEGIEGRGWWWGEQRPDHRVRGWRVQGLDSVQFTARDPQGFFPLNFWPGTCQTYKRRRWTIRTAPHPRPPAHTLVTSFSESSTQGQPPSQLLLPLALLLGKFQTPYLFHLPIFHLASPR